MRKEVSVSVLLATYKRDEILKNTLNSLTRLAPAAFSYEIIIIDNNSSPETRLLVESYQHQAPIVYLAEPKSGKNSALTTGLSQATGKLLVFTDDDIIADRHWLNELYAGVARHPGAQLFGGRIIPKYPENHLTKESGIDFEHWFLRSALVIADWQQAEGPIRAGHIWGPNMAVRRSVFESGIAFNPDIGPRGNDYVMGSETEFLHRAFGAGYKCIYLPYALVHHQIREEQLTLEWMRARAFRSGKGQAALSGTGHLKCIGGVPRYLYKKYLLCILRKVFLGWTMNQKQKFSAAMDLEFIRGQITQFITIHND
jgi:glucosyl-dolichyl phosphate glucuronosyltransferase